MNQSEQHAPHKGIDPVAIFVAVILVCGIAGIAAGSYVKSRAASATIDSSAILNSAENSSALNDGVDTSTSSVDETNATDELPSFDAKTYFAEKHTGENGQAVHEPLLIGDSVAAGAAEAFYEFFPYGLVDAEVSRNIWESPYPSYRDEGTAGKVIIFCLGTNNAVVDWQIDDELLNSVENDKVVFFVNTRCTEEWVDSTNHELAAAVKRHPNLVGVIDWYGYSEGHDEWFAGDGTHLTEEGARIYMGYIYDNITAYLDKHPLP